jgi:hypothetical protein
VGRRGYPAKMADIPVNQASKTSAGAAEWEFLLAASSAQADVDRLRRSLAKPLDWNAIFQLAERHGVSSLMSQNLKQIEDAVPELVVKPLRQRHELNIHRSLFLARELIRVLDCLDGLGITAVPYKGIVFSEIYYSDIAARQSGDMDLFVRAQDVTRIKGAVRELGYTARMPIPEYVEAEYIATGYECTFDSQAGQNLLELQWALQPRFYSVDFEMEGLFERAIEVTVAGRRMKTPSAEDLLLVLSLHAAKHVWGRLIWLRDIAQITKRELDWKWVQRRARELGVQRILHVTLLLTERLLGSAIPSAMKNAIWSDLAAMEFAQRIAGSIEAGVEYEEQKVSYFRLMMELRERRSDRVRFLSRLAFTPGPGEWEAIRLPLFLFPFYRVVRIVRLAGRLVR